MNTHSDMIEVGSLEQLERDDAIVVSGADRPVVVFYNGGQVRAVDNRCPHMGFPLHKGGCRDGIITCPWHHARFEARSGSTFDLFADDVEPFDVKIEDGRVYVSALPRSRDEMAAARRRLREGLQMDNGLVCAKAILTLLGGGVDSTEIVREITLFGVANRDDWSAGLTSLVAIVNLRPYLNEDNLFRALYQGARRVAADCRGQAQRRERYALESSDIGADELANWMVAWTQVRHRDAVERVLLTALANQLPPRELTRLIFQALTFRMYADSGHTVDFANKAFEALDLIGWEHAAKVLPSQCARLAGARGGEEQNSWRQPVDLVPLVEECVAQLPQLFADATGAWSEEDALARELLGDDPHKILGAIRSAVGAGATPAQLGKAAAYAAAVRLARFSAANEIGDWITALHTFSYCHAMHQVLKRCPDPSLTPGVVHGAISIYLDRCLNVPPAHLPAPDPTLPDDREALLNDLLDSFDRRSGDDLAARLVARYLHLGQPIEPLIDRLALAVLREDADFHLIQMLEAATSEYNEWGPGPQGSTIMIATVRFFAAYFPTQRTQQQTAQIALRLHRGEKVYEDEAEEAISS